MEKRICPNCGSEKLEPYTRYFLQILEETFPNTRECHECGYSGFTPVKDGDVPEDFEKQDVETGDRHLPLRH